ncbi:MAG: TMEM175 family protein [Nitrososphaeraceae archaeon]
MSARIFTPDIKIEHVISFSDAVFAFAITLMALTIDIPDLPTNLSQSELLQRLDDSYPQLEDYIISFAVIAIFWISYHQVFNHVKGSHISMVYLNLLFLLFITLLSLTTSFVTNYASYQIPYIIYCIVVIMTSSLLVLIWWYATKDYRLVDKGMHPLFIKGTFFALLAIPIIFSISIVISFIDLDIAQYFWLGIIPMNVLIRYKYKH